MKGFPLGGHASMGDCNLPAESRTLSQFVHEPSDPITSANADVAKLTNELKGSSKKLRNLYIKVPITAQIIITTIKIIIFL